MLTGVAQRIAARTLKSRSLNVLGRHGLRSTVQQCRACAPLSGSDCFVDSGKTDPSFAHQAGSLILE